MLLDEAAARRHFRMARGWCANSNTKHKSASAGVLEKTRLLIISVAQDNSVDIGWIHPVACLALDEIHKYWGTTAVDLSVRMCWVHRVGSCLL
jgi:hypothetical protein